MRRRGWARSGEIRRGHGPAQPGGAASSRRGLRLGAHSADPSRLGRLEPWEARGGRIARRGRHFEPARLAGVPVAEDGVEDKEEADEEEEVVAAAEEEVEVD